MVGSTVAMSKLLVGSKVVQGLTVVLVLSLIRDKEGVVLLLRISGAVVVEKATKGGQVRLSRGEVVEILAVGQGLLFQVEEVKLSMKGRAELKVVWVFFDEGIH